MVSDDAGSEKRIVELKNTLPANVVPNTAVQRQLFINGERHCSVMSSGDVKQL